MIDWYLDGCGNRCFDIYIGPLEIYSCRADKLIVLIYWFEKQIWKM